MPLEESTTVAEYIHPNTTGFEDYNEFEKDISILEHEFEHYNNIYVFVLQYLISLALLFEALAVCCSVIFISFLIYKFKRLRTRTNFIFLNLMISSGIFSFSILLACILETYSEYFFENVLHFEYLFYIVTIACLISINSILLFILFLAIDWLISANYSHVLSKYQRWYKYVILGIYTFAAKDCLLFVVNRAVPYIGLQILLTGIIFITSGITVTVFYVIKKCRHYSPEQSKLEYALVIPCTFFLMWLPLVLTFFGAIFFMALDHTHLSYKYSIILTLVSCFLGIFAFASPLVFVHLLGRLDKNFRASYEYVFKKAVRNYTQHDCDEDLFDNV